MKVNLNRYKEKIFDFVKRNNRGSRKKNFSSQGKFMTPHTFWLNKELLLLINSFTIVIRKVEKIYESIYE